MAKESIRQLGGHLGGHLGGLLRHLAHRTRDLGRPGDATDPAGGPMPRVAVVSPFLDPAEAAFLTVLENVVGKRGRVLAKVSLAALLDVPGDERANPGRGRWHRRLGWRTVDYLCCDNAARPRVVVELDPPGPPRPKRAARQRELDALLAAARLPAIRVEAAGAYNALLLQRQILPHLAAR